MATSADGLSVGDGETNNRFGEPWQPAIATSHGNQPSSMATSHGNEYQNSSPGDCCHGNRLCSPLLGCGAGSRGRRWGTITIATSPMS